MRLFERQRKEKTVENKKLFVQRINEALIECGDGRYDYLQHTPLEYSLGNYGVEYVSVGDDAISVHLDSLPLMMMDISVLL